MAIIPLKKVSVYCMKKDADAVLRALQERGVIHVTPAFLEEGLTCAAMEKKITETQERLEKVVFSLKTLQKYDPSKTSFLHAKPQITFDAYLKLEEQWKTIDRVCQDTKELENQLACIRQEILKKQSAAASVLPFAALDMQLSCTEGTDKTQAFLGCFPCELIEKVKKELEQLSFCEAEYFTKTGDSIPAWLIVHNSEAQMMQEILKSNGFVQARLEKPALLPREYGAVLEEQIGCLEREKSEILLRSGEMLAYRESLLAMEDYLKSELARMQTFGKALCSNSVVLIEGYIKQYEKEKLETAVAANTAAYYIDFTEPAEEDENLPTAVENNALVTPFEAVTDMYSIPSARTIDANALMMPFYFAFFGMMLSDAAYGIILTVGSIIVLKMKKPDGTFKKIVQVLAVCGISTLIWGSGFGGWMGFTLHPWLFDPMAEPLKMLILCLSLGVIHLLAGLIMGAYINIKRKRIGAAVCDQVFWIMILACIPFFVLPGMKTVGILLLSGGAIGVAATAGRHNKGIVKKVMGGLSALYGITGYLSDILSYARLFGMALATSVIAMVFNTIAGMMAGSIPGFLFAVVVFLIGHLFNIGINTLGAFVHSARLQYIEFFSKFYEGGGKPFRPLQIQLKNMRMVK